MRWRFTLISEMCRTGPRGRKNMLIGEFIHGNRDGSEGPLGLQMLFPASTTGRGVCSFARIEPLFSRGIPLAAAENVRTPVSVIPLEWTDVDI